MKNAALIVAIILLSGCSMKDTQPKLATEPTKEPPSIWVSTGRNGMVTDVMEIEVNGHKYILATSKDDGTRSRALAICQAKE